MEAQEGTRSTPSQPSDQPSDQLCLKWGCEAEVGRTVVGGKRYSQRIVAPEYQLFSGESPVSLFRSCTVAASVLGREGGRS